MDGRRGFRGVLATGLLLGLGSGCGLFGPKALRLKSDAAKPPELPAAVVRPDGGTPLAYQTRLIDQPAGSAYLNGGLWEEATNPLSHELTTLLALNGLRVGVVGTPPAELERLASSEASVLSPMRRSGAVGQPRTIPVNGPIESCTLAVVSAFNGEAKSTKLELVECGLAVTATPIPGGDKLKVRGEFQIQHGERQPWLRPTSDGSGFARTDQRASQTYPALAFEVTLGRTDTLVVGAADDPADKLGQSFFFAASSDRLRQRVLLVQVGTVGAR